MSSLAEPGIQLDRSRSRWQRLESIFLTASQLPAVERTRWLDRECAGDGDLRTQAESMLALDDVAEDELNAIIEGAASSLFRPEPIEGSHFGAWRIEREIGRGGMGAVYLALRDGADFEKLVAIKVIKRGVNTAAVLSRFLDERRILASLDHPYIARLIDGDTSPDGHPYFIMEFVDGVSITDYCLRRPLTIRQRCELFRRVCEPVSYAHGKLVIHRDLKPANILITSDGTPRLLDFGIAKLLNTGAPDDGSALRLTRALTPQYASPEQKRGEQVDTATDIYSLGVILRELLDPATMPEDLTAIISKATADQPERRYRSVHQLSDDVRCYLESRPVSAHNDSWLYRTRCFTKRNRVGVSAAVAACVLLTAGVTSILWEAREAKLQRQKAEQRLGQMVELANHALFNVQTDISRLQGATDARRNLVKSTLEYLDKLRQESVQKGAAEDPRLLSTLASAYHEVARIEGSPLHPNRGDLLAAEDSFTKAQKISITLLARDPDNLEYRLQSAGLNSDFAEMTAGTGHTQAAIALFARARQDTEFVLAADPRNFEARKISSVLHLRLNTITLDRDTAAARRDNLAQLPLNEALRREHPQDIDCLLNLASTWSQIGAGYQREGKLPESIEAWQKTATLREQAFALRPADATAQRDLLIVYGHIGDSIGSPYIPSQENFSGAIGWYQKAAAIAKKMSEADPSDERSRQDYAIALMRIGASQTAAGRPREALVNLNASAAILDRISAGPLVNVYAQTAVLHEYLARALQSLGQADAAIAHWQRSVQFCDRILAVEKDQRPCRKQVVLDHLGLAALMADRGDVNQALSHAALARDMARTLSASNYALDKAFWARALAGTGAVYMTLAKHTTSGQSLSNWHAASENYRLAIAAWVPYEHLSKRYSEEAHLAAIHLAECQHALGL